MLFWDLETSGAQFVFSSNFILNRLLGDRTVDGFSASFTGSLARRFVMILKRGVVTSLFLTAGCR